MQNKLDALHYFLRKYGTPQNWLPVTLGDLADIVGGGTPKRDDSRFWQGGTIPWATPTDLTANNSKHITHTEESITETGLSSSAATLLPEGTILYTSRATIGAKAINKVPMATNQGFASFIPKSIDGDFLFYLIGILTPVIKRLGAGTTFDEVSKRDIRKAWCSIPKMADEQVAIAQIIDCVDAAIDRARGATERAVDFKLSLMQKVFLEGTRNERLKKTLVGFMPESWEMKPVCTVVTEFEYGLPPVSG
jgi:type I restriction enzyme, S subunit